MDERKEIFIPKEERVTGAFSFEEFKKIYEQIEKEGMAVELREKIPGLYKRYSYPELAQRENKIAKLIGMEEGELLLYNSGMAALRDGIESEHVTKGEVILYSPKMYPETVKYIEEDLKKRGIKTIPFDSGKPEEISSLIKIYHPKMVIVETVANAPGMPVLDIEKFLDSIEEINKKYEEKLSLENVIRGLLERKAWIKEWLSSFKNEEKEKKLSEIVNQCVNTARKVNEIHSYMPLRKLVKDFEEKKIYTKERRQILLELKSILDTAWLAKREKPVSVILDNTIPTAKVLDLASKIKKRDFPILVVESGTKFYAKDIGTMGMIYSNSKEKILELKIQRMRTGTYLPSAVEKMLPDFTEEEFEVRSKRILANTKRLAETMAKLTGRIGIEAISHPNLPGHPNYEYTKTHMPEGASAIFYVMCKDSLKTAEELNKILGDKIEFGGSFGFEKTRLLPLPGGILRIAGGNESPEELEKILETLEKIT